MLGFDAPSFGPPGTIPDALAAPQAIETLRWASAGYATRPADVPASTPFAPRILGDVEVAQTALDSLGVGGVVALTVGAIRLADGDGALTTLARYGLADGRALRLRTLEVLDRVATDFGQPFSAARLAFAGLVRGVVREAGQTALLSVGDVTDRLNVPLQPTRYAGTGGLEGGAGLTDRPKPVCLGRVFNAEPVYLGRVDLGDGALDTFQVHWRRVQAIDAVRLRGVPQTLVGSAPAAGQARAWTSLGLFQTGSAAEGAARCDARGDAVGGYVNSTAGVLRRLLGSLGPGLGDADLDPLSWNLAEAELPGEVGWYDPRPSGTAAQAAQRIVAGCGAVLVGGRDGRLRLFDPLARVATPQWELDVPRVLACRPVSLPAALLPLPVATAVRWRPNWAPLTDLAGSVIAEREALAADSSGPERAQGLATLARQAVQRELAFDGLFWSQADAAAHAAKWQAWIDGAPAAFEVQTDRYLGVLEMGHVGRLTYPLDGLRDGALCTVLALREAHAGRRLTLTCITLPE